MSTPQFQVIDEVSPGLMNDPLDWFFAEHHRHRQFCRLVEQVAQAQAFDGETVTRVVEFLRHDLALHIIDEEEDLFPLLRRRAVAEDGVEHVLGRLSAEHKTDGDLAATVRERLEACLERRTAPSADPQTRQALLAFSAQELQHLALENAVVLPLARLRLSPRDLKGLGRRLAARRGQMLELIPA
ncbi:MAG: hemerythrin domain-containing protein [Phenylobacterium sp.]|uniref:hemerythrin domain-containing protein n=1 Tax=Phenylobacterium sp. TaxID=1871053 RepID=UPI00391C8A9F